jgi:phosphohistidine phosphatase SixA
MSTLVDLLRHGEAVPSHPDGDSARALSSNGVTAIESLARRYATRSTRPGRIFCSPLLRARQTAALVCAALGTGFAPEILTVLHPDGEPSDVVTELAAHARAAAHVLLVGHQPLLGDLAGHLTDGSPRSLSPGELVRIEFAGRPARRAGRITEIAG